MKGLLIICFVFAAIISASGQVSTKENRDRMFKKEIAKAKWVLVTKDETGIPFYVDSLTMGRFMNSVVIFLIKSEKKDAIEYTKNLGGCTKHIIIVSNKMLAATGDDTLKGGEMGGAEPTDLVKGTINYSILEYVCKNAPELKMDDLK